MSKYNVFSTKAGFDPNQARDPDGKWSKKPGPLKDRPCFKEWFGDSKIKKANGEPKPLYHGGPDKITAFDDRYAGDTTANNDHGAFYFSDQYAVAEDYSREAFKRRYRDYPEGLIDDGYIKELPEFDKLYGYRDQYAFVDDLADENINVVSAYMRMENPIVIDARWENLNAVRKHTDIQALIGVLKGESVDMIPDMIYELLDPETYDWIDSKPDGIIIKNVIDDIGPGSKGFQDVHIAIDPNQIKSVDAKSFCHETDIRKSGAILIDHKAGFREDQPRDESGKWTDKWAGMRNFEDSIRNNDFETAGLYDKDGKPIFKKRGGRTSVNFTREEQKMMRNAVLTHNHPGLSSFSHNDIRFLFSTGLNEIRAINSEGDVFVMRQIAEYDEIFEKFSRSPIQALARSFEEATAKVEKLTDLKIIELSKDKLEISKEMINKISRITGEESHLIWEEVANSRFGRYSLEYTKK